MRRRTTRLALVASAVAALTFAVASAWASTTKGPSSSETPYLVPTAPGVDTTSILSVGDAATNGYRMAGIPDGLGAFDNHDGTFTLLMNHELTSGEGAVHAHGATGAFVSKWTIDKRSLRALKGEDLIQQISAWTGVANGPAVKGIALGRLCSADLPAQSALYNPETGLGYRGRFFLNGEEVGTEGRAYAHEVDGTTRTSWELGFMGKGSWENLLANPATGDKTVVVGMQDNSPYGPLYVYVGTKQRTGNPVEKAGLVGGKLYAIAVDGIAQEPATGIPSGTPFHLVEVPNAQAQPGAVTKAYAESHGATRFNRPEDGSWNPSDPRQFYWVTTSRPTEAGGASRMWRLNFDPTTGGGTIDMLLNGTEGHEMLDNVTVDHGRVIALEDVGNHPRLGKVWQYTIATGAWTELAQHDPERFRPAPPGSQFKTQDEESSGVIPAPFLGAGVYLLDVQAHYRYLPDPTLVEGGQLLTLTVPTSGENNDAQDGNQQDGNNQQR